MPGAAREPKRLSAAVVRWVATFLLVAWVDLALTVLVDPADFGSSARLALDGWADYGLYALALAALLGLVHVAVRARRPLPAGHYALSSAIAAVGGLHLGYLAIRDGLLPAALPRDHTGVLVAAGVSYLLLRAVTGLVVAHTPARRLATGGPVPWLAGAAAVVGGAGFLLTEPTQRSLAADRLDTLARRPNIVFIIADTLRRDRLGTYGYRKHDTSPFLDTFAERATVFDRAHANSPWTIPSIASLWTGRWTIEHGASAESRVLGVTYPTLTEILGDHGYRTMAVSSNSMINGPKQGYMRGFDLVEDTSIDPAKAMRRRRPPEDPLSLRTAIGCLTGSAAPFFQLELPENPGDLGARETTEAALQCVDMASRDSRPFFLFVGYMANHMPYSVPEDFDLGFEPAPRPPGQEWDPVLRAATISRFPDLLMFFWRQFLAATGQNPYTERDLEFLSDAYDATVRYMDAEVETLVEGLEARGLLDDTVVIFTSDHGESLGEATDFGHGRVLDAQLIDVPLIIHDPVREPGRVSRPVQSLDVLPTLLALLGIDEREVSDGPLPGVDLLGDAAPRSPIVAELHYNTGKPRWEHAPALTYWLERVLNKAAVEAELRLMENTTRKLQDATLREKLGAWIDLVRNEPDLWSRMPVMEPERLDAPIGPAIPGATFREFRDYCFAARRAIITEDWKYVVSSNGSIELIDLAQGRHVAPEECPELAALEQALAQWRERVTPFSEPVDLGNAPTIPYLR